MTLDKQVHGGLKDQVGLVNDLLSQIGQITQLCEKKQQLAKEYREKVIVASSVICNWRLLGP